MTARPQYVVALIILFVAGCKRNSVPQDPVTRMGFSETVLGHALLENAIALSNSWIAPDKGIRFAPNWTKSDGNAKGVVPVYAISTLNAPANYMIAVPAGCRCVFIQPRAYEDWLDKHLSQDGNRLEVDETRLLAFMLLHEAGHISNGDLGEFDGSGSGSLNKDPTAEKQREVRADEFAVEQLKHALARTKDVSAWLDAQRVTMDLANLGFEMQEVRELRYFGSQSLGTPAAFYDIGYTHPNFELRLLTVNNAITPTDTSRQLLANFLERRVSHNPVLFRAPELTN